MKCPKCQSEAVEKKIVVFEETYGMVCSGCDPVGLMTRAFKKAKLAIEDKKLYVCTKDGCHYEFEA